MITRTLVTRTLLSSLIWIITLPSLKATEQKNIELYTVNTKISIQSGAKKNTSFNKKEYRLGNFNHKNFKRGDQNDQSTEKPTGFLLFRKSYWGRKQEYFKPVSGNCY